jgi:nitroimidazol reductase NimA-like FMN-containing flavoprotein (pyridoxamine 5'-phosphate oxidase superfamily)
MYEARRTGYVRAHDGGDMKLTKTEKDFIESMRVVRVATVDPDSVVHNVPVCPLMDRDKIYFATERKARKVRNIERNPNVTLVFDEYTEAWDYLRGIMIQGTGRIVNGTEFRRLRQRIYAKYPQYESKAALGERDSVIVELKPVTKFSWGLNSH